MTIKITRLVVKLKINNQMPKTYTSKKSPTRTMHDQNMVKRMSMAHKPVKKMGGMK